MKLCAVVCVRHTSPRTPMLPVYWMAMQIQSILCILLRQSHVIRCSWEGGQAVCFWFTCNQRGGIKVNSREWEHAGCQSDHKMLQGNLSHHSSLFSQLLFMGSICRWNVLQIHREWRASLRCKHLCVFLLTVLAWWLEKLCMFASGWPVGGSTMDRKKNKSNSHQPGRECKQLHCTFSTLCIPLLKCYTSCFVIQNICLNLTDSPLSVLVGQHLFRPTRDEMNIAKHKSQHNIKENVQKRRKKPISPLNLSGPH